MKNVKSTKIAKTVSLISLVVIFLSSCSYNRQSVYIPAKQDLLIDYPNYDLFSAHLKNTSIAQVNVSVQSNASAEEVRGFGLNGLENAKVMVEKGNHLVLSNPGKNGIRIKLSIQEEKPVIMKKKEEYISFILKNESTQNIPLIIPSVMNPNLSPLSSSGVDLKIGQEILFRSGVKKYLLLKVDATIKDNAVIEVAHLLKKRKKELGLS